MVLNDWLASADPDGLIYLGCEGKNSAKVKVNGSGFVYIGYAKNAPAEEFGTRTIMKIYPHESDFPGTAVIIDGKEHGKFWMWHECDPDAPVKDDVYIDNDSSYEHLLMAIAKQAVYDYKIQIKHVIRTNKPKTVAGLMKCIRFARRNSDLDFLEGSSVGEYMIQTIEDEVKVEFLYPKIKNMPYDRRAKFLEEKRQELLHERYQENEKKAYAKIKGRSVKHE